MRPHFLAFLVALVPQGATAHAVSAATAAGESAQTPASSGSATPSSQKDDSWKTPTPTSAGPMKTPAPPEEGGSFRSLRYDGDTSQKDPRRLDAKEPEQEPEPAAPPPMNLEDARYNFPSVLEAFAKKTQQTRGLTFVELDEASVKAASGPGLYTGLARFKDKREKTVNLEVLVDFSKDVWEVRSSTPAAKKAL